MSQENAENQKQNISQIADTYYNLFIDTGDCYSDAKEFCAFASLTQKKHHQQLKNLLLKVSEDACEEKRNNLLLCGFELDTTEVIKDELALEQIDNIPVKNWSLEWLCKFIETMTSFSPMCRLVAWQELLKLFEVVRHNLNERIRFDIALNFIREFNYLIPSLPELAETRLNLEERGVFRTYPCAHFIIVADLVRRGKEVIVMDVLKQFIDNLSTVVNYIYEENDAEKSFCYYTIVWAYDLTFKLEPNNDWSEWKEKRDYCEMLCLEKNQISAEELRAWQEYSDEEDGYIEDDYTTEEEDEEKTRT
ncbi:hypothetical protein ABK040_003117 [Willaertia magna]